MPMKIVFLYKKNVTKRKTVLRKFLMKKWGNIEIPCFKKFYFIFSDLHFGNEFKLKFFTVSLFELINL